ncbi:FAD-dependent oxidoreductase [Paenibacillus pinisoli]|uniref:FAD-dependent oxidoreductase n=2 Tax=Paenibacillus pinisoli TaxID=1276110 RepID=A0A3A6PIK1_9BACL|nr:FAD-dependent oxidoreductase [Paenibacillus pinisoli]
MLCGCVSPGEEKQEQTVMIDNPDVVIIGSEIEGAYLARAAQDEGLSVVILDPRKQAGGQLLQGQMLYLDEPTDASNNTLLQGKVGQLFDEYKKGNIRKLKDFEAYYKQLLSGIHIESGIEILSLDKDQAGENKQALKRLTYKNQAGEEKTVEAKYWVENTDFAYLSSQLSQDRIPGVESIFNLEEKAHMASSIMMKFKGVDWDSFQKAVMGLDQAAREERYGGTTYVTNTFTWGFGNVGSSYTPTREDIFLRGLNIVNQKDGEALINALLIYNVDPSDSERVEEAVALGKAETDRVLTHLQKELPGWEKAQVNGYPDYLYIRDYDRYVTDYVLTATDMFSGSMFWDNVSIGGYPLDIQGVIGDRWGRALGKPDKYGMPLRSFMLKDYSNVLVAGKNVGATAPAYGSARIQPNTSLAGEVIGIILGQIDGKTELADLTEEDMKELHAYIEKKYKIELNSESGANKIANYTEEELILIDKGHLIVSK